jgi:PmbA protein
VNEREALDLLSFVVDRARSLGATSADALLIDSDDNVVGVRKGEVEKIQRTRSRGMGLRIFQGHSQAIVSTSDLDRSSLESLVRGAVAMAEETQPDPFSGLPGTGAGRVLPSPSLEIFEDPAPDISQEERIRLALETEKAAFAEDPRIRNSEGAEFQSTHLRSYLVNTDGFSGGSARSLYGLSCSVIARDGDSMERDYWYEQSHFYHRLPHPEEVGRHAGRRAISRLHPRRPKTTTCPVLFDAEVARSLVSHLIGALSGYSLYRNATYLKDRENSRVASTGVTIREDPLLPGGFGSRPFDGEGVVSKPKVIVEHGLLKTYLFDAYSGRKNGRSTTGNASRSLGDAPHVGVSNILVEPGGRSKDELLHEMKRGLYVTELIGFGVNAVTGDYSRGAFGFWVEDGEIQFPVSELTIAGNLDDMFQSIVEVGNDRRIRSSIASPSILLGSMRVGGNG